MREGPAMQEMELSRPKARRLFLDFLFLIPHESFFYFTAITHVTHSLNSMAAGRSAKTTRVYHRSGASHEYGPRSSPRTVRRTSCPRDT
jgi:hypothetical protein